MADMEKIYDDFIIIAEYLNEKEAVQRKTHETLMKNLNWEKNWILTNEL